MKKHVIFILPIFTFLFTNCGNNETCLGVYNQKPILLDLVDSMGVSEVGEINVFDSKDTFFLLKTWLLVFDSVIDVFYCRNDIDTVFYNMKSSIYSCEMAFYRATFNDFGSFKSNYPKTYAYIFDSLMTNSMEELRYLPNEFKYFMDKYYEKRTKNEVSLIVFPDLSYENILIDSFLFKVLVSGNEKYEYKDIRSVMMDFYITHKIVFISAKINEVDFYLKHEKYLKQSLKLLQLILEEKFVVDVDTLEPHHHTFGEMYIINYYDEIGDIEYNNDLGENDTLM
ncbi:MAG: hypothetical protein JJU02_05125 [Cryomorphaceae bacterium]|nr:hypothetical protein [Cryomorphaceae bacterium]